MRTILAAISTVCSGKRETRLTDINGYMTMVIVMEIYLMMRYGKIYPKNLLIIM
jgi:hypothetical protein